MKDGIKILADMTRNDIEKSLSIKKENLLNVNAEYSPRYGWHLKRKEKPSVPKNDKLLDI